jgi:hypothetical protein
MEPCIVRYRGGIYDQQDATNSQYLLPEMLYIFRTIIAHHQELGTVCAAVRCYKLWVSPFSRLYSGRGVSAVVQSSWNVMEHGDAREGKWSGNWRMEWVASTLHTTSEHGVSSINTADAHTSAASSLLNWRPRRFKWTRPFRRKTKSGFCACATRFRTSSTIFV